MPRKKKGAGPSTVAQGGERESNRGPVSACCPYCASRVSLPIACLGVSIAPGAESPYFRRLQKAENLVVEFAGVVKSVLRGKRILEQWLVDSGFVDSAL